MNFLQEFLIDIRIVQTQALFVLLSYLRQSCSLFLLYLILAQVLSARPLIEFIAAVDEDVVFLALTQCPVQLVVIRRILLLQIAVELEWCCHRCWVNCALARPAGAGAFALGCSMLGRAPTLQGSAVLGEIVGLAACRYPILGS